MWSDFFATLGFSVDMYDSVLLIDSINRTQLPTKDYPFVIGDQLLSVDGRDVQLLLQDFAVYSAWGNPSASKRLAAQKITGRSQSLMPHATDVMGKTATVVIHRQSGGTETCMVTWT